MASWDYSLETGYAAIDNEHREIVRALGLVHEAIERGSAPLTGVELDRLTLRIVEHFQHEEEIMAATNYPQTALHKEAHATFLADVAKGRRLVAVAGLSDTVRQLAFGRLNTWFLFHIKALDIGLAQHALRSVRADVAATR